MNKIRLIVISVMLALLAACQVSGPTRLQPFTTDGCSRFPEGTHAHRDLWHQCCTEHDKKYWAGGSAEERMSADEALHACVKSVGKPEIAALMLAGVRVGGSPWWPSAFRWGYGWPFSNGYRALTPEEQEQVHQLGGVQGLK
ncbi:MAG: hypothetical protein B7Y56_04160 [Gallionellales bacterium 35-53-114]|nr:MAG: hypothetical protein B7Y56_04160 [Gallionellales bacterium 35-53-114]OYZ65291.1 MAG: hypothetical protein B7Y04_01320 [Gallionellales bacterium 24-53-125]OZB08197.1 MAG: hypothetical protein B7X61_11770 [Gallionellales bacterium 39-52-133]HQS58124.1 hypothetical protein [Gallionellaceae bacterium]HQS73679.1 hypothetical protein [Gallionellaceae bacterium]